MRRKALFILNDNEARIVDVEDHLDYIKYKKWRWMKTRRVFTKKFDYIITPFVAYTLDFSVFFNKTPRFSIHDQELITRLAIFENKTSMMSKIMYIMVGFIVGLIVVFYLIKYGVIHI